MIGATVMPHAVYAHSALTRDGKRDPRRRTPATLPRTTRIDVVTAMLFAGTINIAMLLLAASALAGRADVTSFEDAHRAASDLLGPTIGILLAAGLLAAGLASTSVGRYAGGVIMEGQFRRRW